MGEQKKRKRRKYGKYICKIHFWCEIFLIFWCESVLKPDVGVAWHRTSYTSSPKRPLNRMIPQQFKNVPNISHQQGPAPSRRIEVFQHNLLQILNPAWKVAGFRATCTDASGLNHRLSLRGLDGEKFLSSWKTKVSRILGVVKPPSWKMLKFSGNEEYVDFSRISCFGMWKFFGSRPG